MNDVLQTRKEREKQLRKTEILEAAKKLFSQKGFLLTTLDEIAVAAEFGKGTIYNYFTSKDEIYIEIINEVIDNHLRIIKESDSSTKNPIEFIELYAKEIFRYCLSNSEGFKLYIREIVNHRTDTCITKNELFEVESKEREDILTVNFKKAIKQKLIVNYNPDKLRAIFDHMIFSYIHYLLNCKRVDELNLNEEIDVLLKIFLNGILSR